MLFREANVQWPLLFFNNKFLCWTYFDGELEEGSICFSEMKWYKILEGAGGDSWYFLYLENIHVC